ncbi:hypothetical protein AVEN_17333-1 [Araneus ventricosus]|uniref:Uncharacterized protein n=1 Tax=Araneus ventricosus TaxID=182803 RepID=A0A4Y2TSU0_ARAVE|nr:hypothetical protein AVEN_132913-1 [Araneus ventricosus]GBO03713.1 hypothetical protein AVEN_17333-1 [Araneus ventricosus]
MSVPIGSKPNTIVDKTCSCSLSINYSSPTVVSVEPLVYRLKTAKGTVCSSPENLTPKMHIPALQSMCVPNVSSTNFENDGTYGSQRLPSEDYMSDGVRNPSEASTISSGRPKPHVIMRYPDERPSLYDI